MSSNKVNNLPPNWSWVKLDDVSQKIHYGYTASSQKEKVGPKLLRITDIQNGIVNWDEVPFCEIDEDDIEKYLLKKNDIVFARTGATVGKSFLIKGKIPNSVFASYLIRVQLSAKVVPQFIYLFFQSNNYWIQIKKSSVGTGQPNVNATKLKDVYFPLPLLTEQKKIVEKIEELFSDLGNGVASLKKAKEQLRLYRQAVLSYAFSGRLVGEFGSGKLAVSKEHLPYKQVVSKAAEPKVEYSTQLPAGWKWVKLGEVAQLNPRLPFEKVHEDKLVTFLPMRKVKEQTGKYDLGEERKYIEVKKGYTPFINGDVIFAKITPCMENGKIAVVNNLKNGIGFGSTEFHVFRTKDELFNQYLFYFLIQGRFRAKAQHNMTGAVGQKRVPKRFLEESEIPIPPHNVQTQIVEEIEKRFSEADNLEKAIDESLTKAAALRQSILKQAFEGRLV
ncbi:MAG: restriction endonuclease subunit S [Bacteroidetes bacterium]|nr:restriction endonuclease subunit S [Bacteroidota bacterium]